MGMAFTMASNASLVLLLLLQIAGCGVAPNGTATASQKVKLVGLYDIVNDGSTGCSLIWRIYNIGDAGVFVDDAYLIGWHTDHATATISSHSMSPSEAYLLLEPISRDRVGELHIYGSKAIAGVGDLTAGGHHIKNFSEFAAVADLEITGTGLKRQECEIQMSRRKGLGRALPNGSASDGGGGAAVTDPVAPRLNEAVLRLQGIDDSIIKRDDAVPASNDTVRYTTDPLHGTGQIKVVVGDSASLRLPGSVNLRSGIHRVDGTPDNKGVIDVVAGAEYCVEEDTYGDFTLVVEVTLEVHYIVPDKNHPQWGVPVYRLVGHDELRAIKSRRIVLFKGVPYAQGPQLNFDRVQDDPDVAYSKSGATSILVLRRNNDGTAPILIPANIAAGTAQWWPVDKMTQEVPSGTLSDRRHGAVPPNGLRQDAPQPSQDPR